MDASDIAFSDGFERIDADVCKWIDRWDKTPVSLLKLHGSIDWWDFHFAEEPWRGWVTSRYSGSDVNHPTRTGVEELRSPRPVLLTGTFDKILAYETSIIRDQHVRLHEAFRESTRVVVIGYGFCDKAINSRLIHWLDRARGNRLIVCHAEPGELLEGARPAIRDKWADWRRDGKLIQVNAHVDDVGYDDVAAHLDSRRGGTAPGR